MATSKTSVINQALVLLGQNLILSNLENEKAGRLGNYFYDQARDAVLRSHPWRFAQKMRSLSAETAGPEFKYEYKYALPPDCLKVIMTDDDVFYDASNKRERWEVQGRFLLTDLNSIKIQYTSKVTETTLFDPLFVQCLSAYLAHLIAPGIQGDRKTAIDLLEIFRLYLRHAKSVDAQEGTPEKPIDNQWLESRA
jgi:hypothetical protein